MGTHLRCACRSPACGIACTRRLAHGRIASRACRCIIGHIQLFEGCAFLVVAQDTAMYGLAHFVCKRPSLLTSENGAPIEGGVV